MEIATLLFTYNRSRHTKTVLDALSKNTRLPDKLFIFQDGLRNGGDTAEWQKVNDLIKNVNWCETERIVSECNKGLASSIVSGINYVFENYEAVIVLEDDCVPAISFIDFMYQCFEKYWDNENVFSVGGYASPVEMKKTSWDVYGYGRISSWGWGTWKDRWQNFEKDYELIKKLKQNEESSRHLAMWGSDLESTLVGNVTGACDSWAVFWALAVIKEKGVCVAPYESLVRNIGLDGSGVHCGVTDRYDVTLMEKRKKVFALPDELVIEDEVAEAFVPLFGSYTALNTKEEKKEKILVYGLGNFYMRNEQKICAEYQVEAFIDQRGSGWFAGKKIIKRGEMDQYAYDRILVMILNEKDCMEVKEQLREQGIDSDKILDGHILYE